LQRYLGETLAFVSTPELLETCRLKRMDARHFGSTASSANLHRESAAHKVRSLHVYRVFGNPAKTAGSMLI